VACRSDRPRYISAVVIGVTLPLIPVFAVLVGWHTDSRTRRQWRMLAILAGHFLDVVEGLPTLKVFGRAKAQAEVIGNVTGAYRAATMSALRVAFLSALVLELAAALSTATDRDTKGSKAAPSNRSGLTSMVSAPAVKANWQQDDERGNAQPAGQHLRADGQHEKQAGTYENLVCRHGGLS
jgi:hypothetical protein